MDLAPRTHAEAERWAIYEAMAHRADHYEVDSARGPGWYEAECDCGWMTSGYENVSDEALYEHMHDEHEDWWKPRLREPNAADWLGLAADGVVDDQ